MDSIKWIHCCTKYNYEERQLKNNRKWENIEIDNLKPKDAIEILTKRKYAHIEEIDEDTIGKKIMKNKIVKLISVNDFTFSGGKK